MPGDRRLPKRSSRWTAADAESLLSDCGRSGLALATYCRRRRIEYERLRRWRSKLARERSEEAGPVALKPVRVVAASRSAAGGPLELELGDGRSIRLGADFDAEALRRLLSVLEA